MTREGMQYGDAAKKGSTIESVELSCSDASRVPFPLVSYFLKMPTSHLANKGMQKKNGRPPISTQRKLRNTPTSHTHRQTRVHIYYLKKLL